MTHSASCPTFALNVAHLSDLGMRRANNQDAVGVLVTDDRETWAKRGHLLIVADGMGAHAAGELASKLAVDNILHTYFKLGEHLPPGALRQAIREANAAIHAKGQSSVGFQGMGTTCSCLALLPQGALVAHVGDSRVYRLRDDVLEQLTFDHSLVWEMAAAGKIAEEDVPAYIPKNVITRSLGPHPNVNVDLEGPFSAEVGDVFFLCSDGLSGQVSDEEIGVILTCLAPAPAVQTLVDLANLRGGPDNISVIVAEIVGNGRSDKGLANDQPPARDVPGATLPVRAAFPWFIAGAAICTLVWCLVYGYRWGAVAAGAALVGAMAFALIPRRATPRQTKSRLLPRNKAFGGPYGNGPYRQAVAAPSREVVDGLEATIDTLRSLGEAATNDWSVEWGAYNVSRERASQAVEAGDLAGAIRHHADALRDVMRQLREQHGVPEK